MIGLGNGKDELLIDRRLFFYFCGELFIFNSNKNLQQFQIFYTISIRISLTCFYYFFEQWKRLHLKKYDLLFWNNWKQPEWPERRRRRRKIKFIKYSFRCRIKLPLNGTCSTAPEEGEKTAQNPICVWKSKCKNWWMQVSVEVVNSKSVVLCAGNKLEKWNLSFLN